MQQDKAAGGLVGSPRRETVLVTGATGHVGNVLVRKLLGMGQRVRAMVPPGEDLEPLTGVDVEVVRADVRRADELRKAVSGCSRVYHLAGIVTVSEGLWDLLESVNIRGTRNLVDVCLDSGVERLVYVSSVHALPEPSPGKAVRADLSFDPKSVFGDYARSKVLGSQEVLDAERRGLDAVLVFPSGIVGPYDFRLSELGTLFLLYARGRMKALVDGAYDFVDVRDVVSGLIAAMDLGQRGRGYLLSGHRVTVREMCSVLGRTTGVRPPRIRVPMWLARAAAVFAPLYYRLRSARPIFTRYSLRVLRSNCTMDAGASVRELGFRARPFRETVEDTLAWFRGFGLLHPGPSSG